MADLVVSDEGEEWLLDTTLRTALAVDQIWRCHLFVNDYTPLANVTLANLTEMTLPGYAPQNLDRSLWPPSASTGGQAVSIYGGNPVTFTVTSGLDNAFGYYVTDPSDTVLLWVQRFDTYQAVDALHPGRAVLSFAGRSQSQPV